MAPRFFVYIGAVVLVGVVSLVALLVPGVDENTSDVLLLSAVVATSASSGLGPGILAALLAALADAWIAPPQDPFAIDLFEFVLFLALGVFVSTLNTRLQHALARERTNRRAAEQARESERGARASASAAQFRLSFLAEASEVLGSSLDYETTLQNLARLAIPRLGSCCMVHLLNEHRVIRRVALADVDPSRQELLCELDEAHAFRSMPLDAYVDVIRTGRPELLPTIAHRFAFGGGDEKYFQLMRRLDLSSLLSVPLQAHGQTLGAITILSSRGRSYTVADQKLAEELAHRAGLAVEHARLYGNAQRANRTKDDFLAMLSHELRSPLTSALLCTQMLRKGSLKGSRRTRALETIERNIRLQVRLVGDLLDISRIMFAKLPLSMTKVNLGGVVRCAVDAVRPAAEAQGIHLELQLEAIEVPVRGDAARLQQVVGNLLSNALKFTARGGRIDVRLEQTPSRAKLTVKDTGIGIPSEVLPEIFDRFRQGDNSVTRKYGGLGLGLAIVRHLVESHAGWVTAESSGAGRGATFSVYLPPVGRSGAEPESVDSPASVEEPADIHGLRVLVVDDEDDTRASIAMLLTSQGAEVATAASVREALDRLKRDGRRDVLISDIAMPDADGYALLREIRAGGANGTDGMSAIALTAFASGAARRQALEAGYRFHLAKPVDQGELLATVAEAGKRRPVAGTQDSR